MTILGTANFSLYAVPAAWALSILPHFYAISFYNKNVKKEDEWSNAAPRRNVATLASKPKLTPSEAKFLRAEAAQQNGFENLGLFAAAVLAGNYARLPHETLNTLCAVYLASRVAFNVAYVTIADDSKSALRSVIYLSGIFTIFTFFIKAGNALL